MNILALIKKDVLLELRNMYSIGGVILYLISSVFIVSKVLNQVDPLVWNALFWILFLFIAVGAMLKSFANESGSTAIFYYSVFNPIEVLLAKLVYNFAVMLILSLLLFFLLYIFMPVEVQNYPMLFGVLSLSSLGISVNFSFISAISSQASQNAVLMSILSFPVAIPVLLISLKISAQALGLISDSSISSDILILLAVDMIMFAVSLILFPHLWKS